MKILIMSNLDFQIYKFRKELVERLIEEGCEVYVSVPKGDYVEKLKSLGCKIIETKLERRGMNPLKDIILLLRYNDIIKEIKPDLVITYTIKPNIYGGLISRINSTKYISNITGLGTSIQNSGLLKNVTLFLYKIGLNKSECIFYQNEKNMSTFEKYRIHGKNKKLVRGSGVNLEEFLPKKYPSKYDKIKFLTIVRIMKDKGVSELLEASKIIKTNNINVEFHIAGEYDDLSYKDKIEEYENKGYIKHLGFVKNLNDIIPNYHCIIHPSYHEGLSNVILEAAAMSRPVIATDVPGCRETFITNVSGISIEPKSVNSLVDAIVKFINLDYSKKEEMGIEGRKFIEKSFDRRMVVEEYMEEIKKYKE